MYRALNNLSIDIALGAAVSAAFFARVLSAPVRPQGLMLLGLTVWVIYTADHLQDARFVKSEATSTRHRLHQKYFRTLVLLLIIAVVVCIGLVFTVRIRILYGGLALSVLVLIYLFVSRRLGYLKELMATGLYTLGVLMPAWAYNDHALTTQQMLIIAMFALVVLTNMILFALMSYDEDHRDNMSSLVTIISLPFGGLVVAAVITCFAGVAVVSLMMGDVAATILLTTMEATLVLIFLLPRYFEKNERFRLLGDAVFLFPIIYLLR